MLAVQLRSVSRVSPTTRRDFLVASLAEAPAGLAEVSSTSQVFAVAGDGNFDRVKSIPKTRTAASRVAAANRGTQTTVVTVDHQEESREAGSMRGNDGGMSCVGRNVSSARSRR